jgi:hypothetical protein
VPTPPLPCAAGRVLTARARRAAQRHALHRKRALAVGVVSHWAYLVCVSLAGAAWCAPPAARAASVSVAHAELVGCTVVELAARSQAVVCVLLDGACVSQHVRLRRKRQSAVQPGRVHHGGAARRLHSGRRRGMRFMH